MAVILSVTLTIVVQALTSGGIPSFMDFLFNFKSQELKEDNIITQFYRNGKKIVFYGDDTWEKLFPNHFIRHEGTTSFFVAVSRYISLLH
jgi:ethanolaminephosphotransferase